MGFRAGVVLIVVAFMAAAVIKTSLGVTCRVTARRAVRNTSST